jgi:DNA-binding NarL/FixJ family response regulator
MAREGTVARRTTDQAPRGAERRPVTTQPATQLNAGSIDEAELRILRDYARGMTVRGIAHRHHLSERSVRRRIREVCDAFGVNTGIEAVVEAVRKGLV